jgi:hypothetical protein
VAKRKGHRGLKVGAEAGTALYIVLGIAAGVLGVEVYRYVRPVAPVTPLPPVPTSTTIFPSPPVYSPPSMIPPAPTSAVIGSLDHPVPR